MELLIIILCIVVLWAFFSASSRPRASQTSTYHVGTVFMLVAIGGLILIAIGIAMGAATIGDCPVGQPICFAGALA